MSTLNIDELFAKASDSHKSKEKYNDTKQLRIAEHIKTFNSKCNTLISKYFDKNNSSSINSSFERAVRKSGSLDQVNMYMNFDRDDFKGWNKFVPYKADEYGNNYNARPATCLKLFLEYAKNLGFLPQISFEVWGNKKFTVHFVLDFNENNDTSSIAATYESQSERDVLEVEDSSVTEDVEKKDDEKKYGSSSC